MRVLERLHLVRVGELRSVDLDLCRLGTRFDNRGEDVLLLRRIALHGSDEIGNEIGAALILILDIRPARFGLLLQSRDSIVAAA